MSIEGLHWLRLISLVNSTDSVSQFKLCTVSIIVFFLCINSGFMYLDHILPILALTSITTGVTPFSATCWTTQSSWDVIALAWLR